jgi:hypothetical protein
MSRTMVCNNGPYEEDLFKFVRYFGLSFVGVLMHTFDPLCVFQVIYRVLTRQHSTGRFFIIA